MRGVGPALQTLVDQWADTPEAHAALYAFCVERVEGDVLLTDHRDTIDREGLGFGARGLHWVWAALVETVALRPGRRDTLAFFGDRRLLWAGTLPDDLAGPQPTTVKRTDAYHPRRHVPILYGEGGIWTPPDLDCQEFAKLISLFGWYHLPLPCLIRQLSQEAQAVTWARLAGPYDLVYIDGSHVYEDVRADLLHYSGLVRPGRFLVADDAACGFQMHGMYAGFPGPSQACDELLPPFGPGVLSTIDGAPHGVGVPGTSTWRHVVSVSHLRVWERL